MNRQNLVVHLFVMILCILLPTAYALYLMVALYLFGVLHQWREESHKKDTTPPPARWWTVLGVEPDASLAECTRVRKLLTKIYHPDGGEAPNLSHMQRINDAYETRAALPETPQPPIAEQQSQLKH